MTPEEFAQLERVSRQVLWMYDLTDRERRVAQVIIDHSFARGRAAVVISSLQAFVDMTGLHPGDVSETLKLMRAKGIVQRRGPRDARSYEFLPAAKYWQESKPLYSVERAIARSVEIERENGQGKLPVEEADLEDGMAMASRDEAVRDGQALLSAERTGDDEISESLISRAVEPGSGGSQISKSLISGAVEPVEISKSLISPAQISDSLISKSLTSKSCARTRAGDVTKNVTVHNVTKRAQFADSETNHAFEQLEAFCDGPDFRQYRGKWIKRAQEEPRIILEAVGDVKMYLADPRRKVTKSRGALVFRRGQEIARSLGRILRMLFF